MWQCSFDVACKLGGVDGNMFVTVNKQLSGPGDFRPVYKSECKKVTNGNVEWNRVLSDTDTVADGDHSKEVMF